MKIIYMFGLFLLLAGIGFANADTTTIAVEDIPVAVVAEPTVGVSEDGSSASGESVTSEDVVTTTVPEFVEYADEAFSVILNERNIVVEMFYGNNWYKPCGTMDAGEDGICTNEVLTQIIYHKGRTPEIYVIKGVDKQPEFLIMPFSTEEINTAESEKGENSDETAPSVMAVATTGVAVSEKLVTKEETEVQGVKVVQETATDRVYIDFPTSSGATSTVEVTKASENGKVLLTSNEMSVETEDKIVADTDKNLLYVESGGTNYQLYLTPNAASELVKKEGYEPAQGAELVVENNMPTYKIYAKKPVKLWFLTIGEEEVVLKVDQTGNIVENAVSSNQ